MIMSKPPLLFPRNNFDYYLIMGGIFLILGLGLLSAIFPIIEFLLSIGAGGVVLMFICIGIGKYLKYRRLEHEAYYGDPSTFPEAKEQNNGKTQ